MVKNAQACPENNHMTKMRWEWVDTVLGIMHTKFQGSATEKWYKGHSLTSKKDVLWSYIA